MKNSGKIAGMLLMLFIAGSLSLSAQRGMRGVRADSSMMDRMKMEQRRMPQMVHRTDSLRMGGMRHGMVPGQTYNRGSYRYPGNRMGYQSHGMRHMSAGNMMMARGAGRNAMGGGMMRPEMGKRPAVHGLRHLENIPDLTDQQKKEIAALRQKQQDEMQILRESMLEKTKELRESQRTNVLKILNAEQKKWVEENMPKPIVK